MNSYIGNMICSLAFGAGLLVAIGTNSKADGMIMDCRMHTIEINNRSTKTVRIEAVRWLDTTREEWISQDVGQPRIDANTNWSGEIELTGLQSAETFITAGYRILEDPVTETWSHIRITSQRHVVSCKVSTKTEIKIVDLRS